MTFNEFKAWLEGFEYAFGGKSPTDAQWAAIKSKLATVTVLAPAVAAGLPERLKSWPFNEPVRRYGVTSDPLPDLGHSVCGAAGASSSPEYPFVGVTGAPQSGCRSLGVVSLPDGSKMMI